MLKQKNPDQVMRLYKNTIMVYRKNSKFNKHRGYGDETMISGDSIAHMHVDDPHFGICITQHFLFHAACYKSDQPNVVNGRMVYSNDLQKQNNNLRGKSIKNLSDIKQ